MKNSKIILILLLIICYSCNAQSGLTVIEKDENNFPKSWEGLYSGQLEIFDKDSVKMQVAMSLEVKMLADSSYLWELIYETEQKDVRSYELQVVNKQEGKYQIDEKNGIILACNYFKNCLISRFEVGTSLLDIVYSKMGESIHFQVIAGKSEREILEIEVENVPPIHTYQVGTYQKAILKKKTLSK